MSPSLDDVLGEPGTRLYHYTTRERSLEQILLTGDIRVGPFEAVNDPREAMDWAVTMVRTAGHEAAPDELRTAPAEFNRALKRCSKVVCFSRDAGRSRELLARGWAHPRMWAQYAHDHSGVCLFFDRDRLIEQMKAALAPHGKVYRGPVRYRNTPPTPKPGQGLPFDVDHGVIATQGMDAAVSRHLRVHHRELFFTKLLDWADEREFRFVVFGQGEAPILVKIADSLVGVCVGWRFHKVYEPALRTLTDRWKVPALRCNWQNGYPNIGLL